MTNTPTQSAAAPNEGSFGATLSGVLASCGTTLAVKLFAGDWRAAPALAYVALAAAYALVTLGAGLVPALERIFERGPWAYALLCGTLGLALQAMTGDTFLQPIIFSVPLVPIAMAFGTLRALLIAEDQRIVREGLRAVLEDEDEVEIVGEAANGARRWSSGRSCTPMWC